MLLLLSGGTVTAQTVTPSQIFQVGETINAELATFNAANASTPSDDPAIDTATDRLPRHVFQKARELLLKVQVLRTLKGLPEQSMPPVEVHEIQPADSKKLLDLALAGLRELGPAFGNPAPPAPVPLVDGKTPTDAYRSVARAAVSIDALGLPAVTPNEVYRVALTIVSDLQKIRAARGLSGDVPLPDLIAGKKPADVYQDGYALLGELSKLVQSKPDFAIPQGITMPARRTGAINPAYVLDLLDTVLGEISATKAKVGATQPTELAPVQTGKTPSDTVRVLTQARAMVATL